MLDRFLDCLVKGRNKEAKSIFSNLKNPLEWIDSTGSTFLHYAAYHSNPEMTQYLIDKGFKVNVEDHDGKSPLTLAVKASDVKIVEILLKNNADIYKPYKTDLSILVTATLMCIQAFDKQDFRQNVQLVMKILFDRVKMDFSEGKVTQFLMNASDWIKFVVVINGNKEIIKFMLTNCYSIDYREPDKGLTALHCTMCLGKFETAKILIEHGANLDTLNAKGDTALHYYPDFFDDSDENAEVLKIFLKKSTHLYMIGSYGMTELEFILTRGKKRAVKTVLESGIDIKQCTRGKSLLSILVLNENAGILDILDELDIQFDVNQSSSNGYTALMAASHYGCSKKMEFLLKHGADVNSTLMSGETALSYALADHPKGYTKNDCNVIKIIDLLLQYGADVYKFFKSEDMDENYFPTVGIKMMLSHLAMLEAVKQPPSTSLSDIGINLNHRYKFYFDSCIKQLDKMKQFKLHRATTLFGLLTDSEDKIITYTDNEKFMLALRKVLKKCSYVEPYYFNTLQRRISKILDAANFKKK